MNIFDTGLYFITDSTGFTEAEFLRRTEAALQGGVTCLQLREKEKTTRDYLDLAKKIPTTVIAFIPILKVLFYLKKSMLIKS